MTQATTTEDLWPTGIPDPTDADPTDAASYDPWADQPTPTRSTLPGQQQALAPDEPSEEPLSHEDLGQQTLIDIQPLPAHLATPQAPATGDPASTPHGQKRPYLAYALILGLSALLIGVPTVTALHLLSIKADQAHSRQVALTAATNIAAQAPSTLAEATGAYAALLADGTIDPQAMTEYAIVTDTPDAKARPSAPLDLDTTYACVRQVRTAEWSCRLLSDHTQVRQAAITFDRDQIHRVTAR